MNISWCKVDVNVSVLITIIRDFVHTHTHTHTHTYIYIYECTENDINTRLAKLWTVIDRLSVIWKSDLSDKIKRSFLQAAVVSILLYGCTTWKLTKRMKKKLDGNHTRVLRAVLNKYWRQHSTNQQLYGHQPPISKTIQIRRTRHAGHCLRSKNELISNVPCGPLHTDEQALGDQLEPIYNSSVLIQDIAWKTCRER